ncbi:hypothetical protein VOLCADRAFT_106487 [Volvox carteri f. nagariensis]|uniref:1-phosphatidylinositol-4-phosphate 5-kinase n=1 Tax=Volvox carteri f. nagariensis TaxID=3068 RepID=D8U7Q2_VOLCA|nr:uncharacterized protein VOLCADRAFT_106487 [Volvox carteri f. nagariensis]EFJ44342.1 hypothetical protein VOLCADRAFT_106487 [Volvox carteri f. nagariensis]|eukprot:XP_002954701.1 hypothetical protein VOLCADRAFT_106487 [Volvox carteri f. nagariensis]
MAGAEAGQPPGEHGGVAGQQPGIATLKYSDGSEYKGTLKHVHGQGQVPHGIGTCVWVDGNRYDGEWRNGLMHGFGTYQWTSGQRYDGEWKDGKRDGVGVKMYVDGSTFHGIWREGKKHGVGVFKPASKDKDKDRARTVVKTSSGKLLLGHTAVDGDSVSNLNAYESVQPIEVTPLQADAYSKESSHAGGAEPTPAAAAAAAATGGGGAGAPGTSSDGVAEGERDRELERGRDREGHRERMRERERDKDLREKEGKVVFIRAFEDGVLRREDKLSSEDAKIIFGQPQQSEEKRRGSKARKKVKRALGLGKKLQQKHGQLLYKGMPGYNLMLRLQHGIRWSVGRGTYGRAAAGHTAVPLPPPPQHTNSQGGPMPLTHKLGPSDFTEKVKVFFPSAGSQETPAHPAGDFKWKDYSPRVFRNLRNMYGIADADYMLSLGGSSALWQLNSPGKSGCMFFLSDDERFLVKTMRKTEIRTLIDMLPEYYKYMESQPDNLVIRFFGVHGVKQVHGRTVRFVVMHNMFNTDLQIHKKFDLKGSTDGRTTGPRVDPYDPKTIFKDLDLDLQFLLDPSSYDRVIRQITSDAEFLRKVDVMDYSLLLGIHFCSRMRTPAQDNDSSITNQHPTEQHHQLSEQQQRQGTAVKGPPEGQRGEAVPKGGSPSGGPPASAGAGGGFQQISQPPQQQQAVALQSMSSHDSTDGEETTGGARQVPGALGGGDDSDGEHVRNFDLFSDRPELDKQLRLIEERMRALGYSDQRIHDILSLVRLRILGDQMKKRSKKAYKVYDGPSTVLMALASRRHGPEALPRLEEADEQPASEDDMEEAQPGKQPPYLGYQMRALAVHMDGDQPPEEVVLCFGIIDILQEWNARKVLERTVKSFTHDSYAISVAPPKLYSARFAEFLIKAVFMNPASAAARGLRLPPPTAAAFSVQGPTVHTIMEERESDFHR